MRKDLSYYLSLDYPVTVTKDMEDGKTYFVVDIPDLPGCGAQGESIEEAMSKLEEAKKLWLEVSIEKGHDIPDLPLEEEFSGKFILRIQPKLHMRLSKDAKRAGLSLNQHIREILENSIRLETLASEIREVKEELSRLKRESAVSPVVSMTYSGCKHEKNLWEYAFSSEPKTINH